MDLLPSSVPSSPAEVAEAMGPPPVPSIVIDKGKGREDEVILNSPGDQAQGSKWGREKLMWDDLAELVTPYQTRPLVFTSQNVVIAAMPATPSIFLSADPTLSGIIPQPRLQAYPLPSLPASPSSSSPPTPASFPLPLPPFNLPHLSPTYLSTSTSASFLIAFFPLSGPQGQGGTLVIWQAERRGASATDWEIKDTWAVPGGQEVIDIAWLGQERQWAATTLPTDAAVEDESLFGETDDPPTARPLPIFHRLPALGPPLPSHSSSSAPPTFLILTASHEIVLHYPVASPTVDTKWPLRTVRCGIFGPDVGVAGLPDVPPVDGEGLVPAEGPKSGKRVRRGKILVRAEDPSIYLVVQSSVPPSSPSAAPSDVMTDANLLGSLGLGGDFDILGELPAAPANPEDTPILEVGDEASGDEPWIEFIECKIDLLGSEATISATLFPPVHFAATSSDQDQDSSEFVTPSAILSHLSFVELADLESAPATVELSADRDIGVVGTFVNRTEEGHTTEMHLWKLKREEAVVPDVFPLLEAKTPETPQAGTPFEWHGSHLSRRVFPDSVVSCVEPVGAESLGLALLGEISQTWVEGVVGKFGVMKLSDLSTPSGWSETAIRTRRARRALPISVATSANSALVASFESSLAFYAHPAKAPPLSAASTPADWSKLCDELASSLGLSQYENSDPSDLIRVVAEGAKRREDPAAVDAVLRRTWEVLLSQQSDAEPFGESEWLLPLMDLQRRMYEAIGDDRTKVASEVLKFAASNAVFSRAFVEGRNGQKDVFQIDSIWSLISETASVLDAIADLVGSVLLERSWNAWNGTSEDSYVSTSPRLVILHHPTTRSLVQSLLGQITALSTFLARLTGPIPEDGFDSTGVRTMVATDLARDKLKDVISRSGINLERLAGELEGLNGTMAGDLDRAELDPPLLSLAIPPGRIGDASNISAAIERLPKKAVEKVRLLLEPSLASEPPAKKRRKVEVEQVMLPPMVDGGMVF